MPTTVLNWNVEWARPSTPRGEELLRRISELRPQVVCLTEAYTDFLPRDGHLLPAAADYGYRAPEGRRKVLLWSRQPWEAVDDHGSPALPAGRFISGTTVTDIGLVRFIAVCVPWRDAHVHSGRRDRKPWADHVAYLCGLAEILGTGSPRHTVLLGDFNQTLPRTRAPQAEWRLLMKIGESGFAFSTTGLRGDGGKLTIDHIAVGPGLTVSHLSTISNQAGAGRLSDHFGVAAVLA